MKKRAWMVSLLGCIALLMACTDEYVDTYMSEVPEVQTKAVWLKQTAWSKIRKENGLLRNEFLWWAMDVW